MDSAISIIENMNFRGNAVNPFSFTAHGIHSYTAKMIPQISKYLIENFSQKGDLVLDPFCGSGTTLLEANLIGRNALGIDINPLSVLISQVKTSKFDVETAKPAIMETIEVIDKFNDTCRVKFPNIDYWFNTDAKDELYRIKTGIEAQKKYLDSTIYRFLLLCFSSIIRKSSNADPYMGKTYKSKRVVKKIASGWRPAPIQYFKDAVNRNLERISATYNGKDITANTQAIHGDAKRVSKVLDEKGFSMIDLVVTSPPYINAQDYFRSYKLELWWLGLATPEQVIALNKKAIGTEYIFEHNYDAAPQTDCIILNDVLIKIWSKPKMGRRKSYLVANYFESMNAFFEEVNHILPKNKYFCLITGNNTICEVEIPTFRILAYLAEEKGFKLERLFRDEIKWRVLFKNRNHNGGVINEEWITVFKKVR
jgi:SAM-dependent methyltransferase